MARMSWWMIAFAVCGLGLMGIAGLCAVVNRMETEAAEFAFRAHIAEPINYARYDRVQYGPADRLGKRMTAEERVEWYLEPARDTALLWGLSDTATWLGQQIDKISSGAILYPQRDGFEIMADAYQEFAPELERGSALAQRFIYTAIAVIVIALISYWFDPRRHAHVLELATM